MEGFSEAKLQFPGDRAFAFTILDDTDDSTVENVSPVYELLHDLGFSTTKTVWPVACPEGSRVFLHAETMADPLYAEFARGLSAQGFELTWHCATMESSERPRIEAGLSAFRSQFGYFPSVHCNHGRNAENIYWGRKRYFSSPLRQLFALEARVRGGRFHGEDEGSVYFWGDLCKKHFKYVRNLTFTEINTLKADPESPYTVDRSEYANYWFSTSDAPDIDEFNRLVTPASLDQLERERGICILSTHLGKRFCRNGRIDSSFKDTMTYLSKKNGWFVPVSTILDHLIAHGHGRPRSWASLLGTEIRHIANRLHSS